MVVKNFVKRNFFRDSVQLLRISEEVKSIPGVIDAAVVMGTSLNKELLERRGLLTEEGRGATENDTIVALKVADGADLEAVLARVEEMLNTPTSGEAYFYSIESAIQHLGGANLALISIPGKYVKEVAMEFLKRGIHVHIFSDHVPLEDEVELKRYAAQHGLLVMGPEAGTSIINGVAVAFANVVRRGPVGVVAAAGTGLQEVTVLLSKCGSGITQGVGVGGRDVKSAVGGIMTLLTMRAFEDDPDTSVITIVSKPPSPDVQERIVRFIAEEGRKAYVTCFIGGHDLNVPAGARGRLVQTKTLHAAVLEAIRISNDNLYRKAAASLTHPREELAELVNESVSRLREGQTFLRALYTGGTLTYEALTILDHVLKGDVWSNTPLREDRRLEDPWRSVGNSVLDLGDEVFTAGRPHPMIDPTIRVERIVKEARDPEVGVIMLDFVLGYGSHPDPAGAHLYAIRKALTKAKEGGRDLIILAHVVGTEEDPQNAVKQERLLRDAGVITFPTNALMAITAALIIKGGATVAEVGNLYNTFLRGE